MGVGRSPTGDAVSLLDRAVRALLRRGWRRGVLEGSPAWTVMGAAAVLVYLGRKAMRREAEVVFSERLRPGESVRITHEPLP
jgi:hypothetical protein